MSLPPGITTITVTGTFQGMDGTPLAGWVIWDAGQVIKDTTGEVILGGPVQAVVRAGQMLAANGGPLVLPCSDSPGLDPQGFAYTVTTSVTPLSLPTAQYLLPTALGPAADMSQLVEVNRPPPYSTVYGVLANDNTWTGANTFDGPVDLAGGLSSAVPVAEGGTGAQSASAALASLGAAAATDLAAETTRAEAAEALAARKSANLSDLASSSAARTSLGLGSAAVQPSSAFDAAGAAAAAQAASAPLAGATFTGAVTVSGSPLTAQPLVASGLTGATQASRYVGATSGGAPSSGTFAVGDFAVDRAAGCIIVCTAAGSPGTWVSGLTGIVRGQLLLTPSQYAPSTQATPAVTSTTYAALDTTNINTGSFTAPASGAVLVTASFVAGQSGTGSVLGFALVDHGAATVRGKPVQPQSGGTANQPVSLTVQFLVTGLTAGNTYNFDLAAAAPSGTITILAFGNTSSTAGATRGAPVIMSVQAA